MPVLRLYGSPAEVSYMARKNKSDSYQYRIVEICIDPTMLNNFPFIESLGSQLNLAKYSEEFYELRQNLLKEVLEIVKSRLTKRQSEVVVLRLQGKTQIQIAEQLGIHQTTVHKLLMGNIDYTNNKRRYGGAIKKLKKVCAKNEKIQEILDRMDELKTEGVYDDWVFDYEDIQNEE